MCLSRIFYYESMHDQWGSSNVVRISCYVRHTCTCVSMWVYLFSILFVWACYAGRMNWVCAGLVKYRTTSGGPRCVRISMWRAYWPAVTFSAWRSSFHLSRVSRLLISVGCQPLQTLHTSPQQALVTNGRCVRLTWGYIWQLGLRSLVVGVPQRSLSNCMASWWLSSSHSRATSSELVSGQPFRLGTGQRSWHIYAVSSNRR
jgi:hypothetical protein